MPEQAEGDKKPVVSAESQKPQASSPPKAPAKPLTGQEQKGLKDEERLKALETKIGDLSLENASLRATINEQKVMGDTGDEEIVSDIDISDSQIEAITKEAADNPALLKDRIKGVVIQTAGQAQRQQQALQRKQMQTQADYKKFLDTIFEQKPHLRQYEKQIGVYAETEFQRTGQGYPSILAGVKQFEDAFGNLIKEKPKTKEPSPSEELPAGAVGETEPVTTPPEAPPEEAVDMSPEALIKRRTDQQNKRVWG